MMAVHVPNPKSCKIGNLPAPASQAFVLEFFSVSCLNCDYLRHLEQTVLGTAGGLCSSSAMPTSPAELLLKVVLTGLQTHYECRGLVDDKRLEKLLLAGKQILYKSHQEAETRQSLGFSPTVWIQLARTLAVAIPVLEECSFASTDEDYDTTGVPPSNADLIAQNYIGLVKDIERLNDLCTIARNLLATTRRSQNLAAERGFDQQVLKLVDVCVRVSARGYDGQTAAAVANASAGVNPVDAVSSDRNRARWQKVVNLYKRLLITCLQFLHNYIMHNEQRKLVLWLDLFGSSSLKAADREAQAREVQEVEQQVGREKKTIPDSVDDEPVVGDQSDPEVEAVDSSKAPELLIEQEINLAETNMGYNIDDVHALFDLMSAERVLDENEKERKRLLMEKIRADLERMSGLTATQLDENPDILLRAGAALREHLALREFSARNAARLPPIPSTRSGARNYQDLPNLLSSTALASQELEITDDDLIMPRTAESAAETLQEAKDELMSRLTDDRSVIADAGWDYQVDEHGNLLDEDGNIVDENGNIIEINPDHIPPPQIGTMLEDDVVDEEEEQYDEDGEDEDYEPRGVGDQERGLLTDVPLVLGPTEIEALPMIIQAGIVQNFGMKGGRYDTIEKQGARNMQAVRCHILLAQEAGRNVLRELLIFIAAWDLPDDEFYFKMMVQIMEAILANGLMSHAYSDFGQAKDIISPAQAVVIKILTSIFRTKYSPSHDESDAPQNEIGPHRPRKRNRIPAPLARVDLLTVRYIFTVFRGNIIPETCALIYLQGQVLKAQAQNPQSFNPYDSGMEDFPLNLWDMERVYEGVYQFLEFFAVLTENNDWKKVLIGWDIVYDLITLLTELETGIPKAGLDLKNGPDISMPVHGRAPPRSAQLGIERPGFRSYANAFHPIPGNQKDSGYDAPQDPSTFEWRNLKKLIVLVLSSLVWRSKAVQDQIREHGGLPIVLGCTAYDGHNPYIKEHAVMCLKFLLEGNNENQQIVRELEAQGIANNDELKAKFGVTADVSGGKVHVQKASAQMDDLERAYASAMARDIALDARLDPETQSIPQTDWVPSSVDPKVMVPANQHQKVRRSKALNASSESRSKSENSLTTMEKLDAMRERFNKLDLSQFTQGLPIRTTTGPGGATVSSGTADKLRQGFGMRDVQMPIAEAIRTAHLLAEAHAAQASIMTAKAQAYNEEHSDSELASSDFDIEEDLEEIIRQAARGGIEPPGSSLAQDARFEEVDSDESDTITVAPDRGRQTVHSSGGMNNINSNRFLPGTAKLATSRANKLRNITEADLIAPLPELSSKPKLPTESYEAAAPQKSKKERREEEKARKKAEKKSKKGVDMKQIGSPPLLNGSIPAATPHDLRPPNKIKSAKTETMNEEAKFAEIMKAANLLAQAHAGRPLKVSEMLNAADAEDDDLDQRSMPRKPKSFASSNPKGKQPEGVTKGKQPLKARQGSLSKGKSSLLSKSAVALGKQRAIDSSDEEAVADLKRQIREQVDLLERQNARQKLLEQADLLDRQRRSAQKQLESEQRDSLIAREMQMSEYQNELRQDKQTNFQTSRTAKPGTGGKVDVVDLSHETDEEHDSDITEELSDGELQRMHDEVKRQYRETRMKIARGDFEPMIGRNEFPEFVKDLERYEAEMETRDDDPGFLAWKEDDKIKQIERRVADVEREAQKLAQEIGIDRQAAQRAKQDVYRETARRRAGLGQAQEAPKQGIVHDVGEML